MTSLRCSQRLRELDDPVGALAPGVALFESDVGSADPVGAFSPVALFETLGGSPLGSF